MDGPRGIGSGWDLAIDLGSTWTRAATAVGQQVECVARTPSIVFWREETGELLVGEEADEASVSTAFAVERRLKRHVGGEFVVLGGHQVAVIDAIALLMRRVAARAIAGRGGRRPGRVVLTHPSDWDEGRLDQLLHGARAAGLGDAVLIPESVAVASALSGEEIEVGEYAAVYGLGGGRLDTAVVRRTPRGFQLVGTPGGREDFGGQDLDERVLRFLGAQLEPADWQRLWTDTDPRWLAAERELRRQARRAKELLSSEPEQLVAAPGPLSGVLRITAEDVERLAADDLRDTSARLDRTIRAAELGSTPLAAVYIAGGSTRIPFVRSLIVEGTGRQPVGVEDPESLAVLGAARALTDGAVPARRPRSPAGVAGGDVAPPRRAVWVGTAAVLVLAAALLAVLIASNGGRPRAVAGVPVPSAIAVPASTSTPTAAPNPGRARAPGAYDAGAFRAAVLRAFNQAVGVNTVGTVAPTATSASCPAHVHAHQGQSIDCQLAGPDHLSAQVVVTVTPQLAQTFPFSGQAQISVAGTRAEFQFSCTFPGGASSCSSMSESMVSVS
jgi:hypothetical protein